MVDHLLPDATASPYDILSVLQTAVLADFTGQKYIRAVEGYLASGKDRAVPLKPALAADITAWG